MKRVHELSKHPGFGAFLQARRQAHRMSGEEFGPYLGVGQGAISKYERTDKVPLRETIEQAVEALDGHNGIHEDLHAWLVAAGYEEELPREGPPPEGLVPLVPSSGTPTPLPQRGVVTDFGEVRIVVNPARWEMEMLEYRVETDTLLPDFQRGDRLVFSSSVPPEPGDRVIIATRRGEQFRRYLGATATGLLVGPPHAPAPDEPIEVPHGRVLGVLMDKHHHYRSG